MLKTGDTQEEQQIELLRRVQRGDRAAFATLYRQFQPRLYAYLCRLVADRFMVEEVLDDVMLVVWKDARKFRQNSRLSTWIFGIAYRKALTAIRSQQRYTGPLAALTDQHGGSSEDADTGDWIMAGLARLSADHRQVILLTYIAGFSCQEIADIAGCPLNTVKTRMFHARRRLRSLLPELAGQDAEADREHG